MTIADMPRALEADDVDATLPQLRAATLRLLAAVLRLGDAELAAPARSALGTRRHVLARMARRADRTTRALDGDGDAAEPADRLLDLSPADLMAALTTSLGGVLGSLTQHAGGTRSRDAGAAQAFEHAREHLAWLELSHVDLDAGYEMHDVPGASLDALAAHFRDARAASDAGDASTSSPFAPLIAS